VSNRKRNAIASFLTLACLLLLLSPTAFSYAVKSGLVSNAPESLNSPIVSSTNWAGYVAASGRSPAPVVTAIYGSWIVQGVSPSTAAKYSSQWIGIGGFFNGDTSLIQTGTESDSARGGTSYGVWWETLPQAETKITEPVSAGDFIQASIICTMTCTSSTQTWKITITDTTKGWTFTNTLTYSSRLKSAEWIEERPSICVLKVCKLAALANFGTASYGQDYTSISGTGSATIAGVTLPIGQLPNSEIVMQSSGGSVIAQPSSISADGSSFTVAWG